MTATLPHSDWAISYAVSGRSAISPRDLRGAPLVQREALVDQLRVVGDRLAVAGEHDLDRHLARLAQRRACTSSARAGGRRRARPTCRRAAARSAGWTRCARSGGRRRSASRRSASQNSVSDGEWPGRCSACSVRPANVSSSPSLRAGGRPARSPPQARNARETDRSAVTTSRGMPWRSISASASSSSRSASAPKSSSTGASRSSATPRRPSGGRGSRAGPCGRCAGG